MNQQRARRHSRRISILAAALIAAGMFSSNAHAQFAVIDATQIANSLREYAEQARRWQEQIQQYQSTLGRVGMLAQSPGLGMELTLKERAPNEGVAERCPDPSGSGGGLLGSMFDMFKPNLNGNILEQQQVVCTNIVLLQNKKYNELVTMVKDAERRKQEIDNMMQRAATDTTPGGQTSSMVKAQELMGKSLAEMQYSMARIQAFDGMIESLTIDQQALANKALSGSQSTFASLLGTVIQGASLEAALQVARTRDR